jgi:hypothetical protein
MHSVKFRNTSLGQIESGHDSAYEVLECQFERRFPPATEVSCDEVLFHNPISVGSHMG